jgi:hypothetical protein
MAQTSQTQACSKSPERIAVSTSRRAQLKVSGGSTTLEIEVLDSNFEMVATGVGKLDVMVDPGLYEIRFRDGSTQESRLVKTEAGLNAVDAPQFDAGSPAPVDRTSTSHEYHQLPVMDATAAISKECNQVGPIAGGLLVMVRNVRGEDQLPFPPDIQGRFSIVDRGQNPAAAGRPWQITPTEHWALWSAAVPAGGYALRIEDRDGSTAPTLQSLWVDSGWQTTLFIPNTVEGPAPELATVHITGVGRWEAWDDASRIAVALENVLTGLRNGRSVVPDDLNDLFHAKFVNPFLGIAAAHALLLNPNRSLKLLKTVVGNLDRLLPRNPDVIALGHRARLAGAKVKVKQNVDWPPMMYAGYRSLIRADAADPGVITDGSAAEAAAARLRLSGIWTTWDDTPTRTAGERGIDQAGRTADPAAERLRSYITSAAELQQVTPAAILDQRSLSQLALATGLPSGAVSEAVQSLQGDDRTGGVA